MRYFINNDKSVLVLCLVLALFFSLMPKQIMGKEHEILLREKQNNNKIEEIKIVTGSALIYTGEDQEVIREKPTIVNFTDEDMESKGIEFYYGKQEYKSEYDELSAYLYSDRNPYAKSFPKYREEGSHTIYCVARDKSGTVIATGSAVVIMVSGEQKSEEKPDVVIDTRGVAIDTGIKITTGSAVYGSEKSKESLVKKAELEYGWSIEYSKYENSGYSDVEPIYHDAGTHIVYYRAKDERNKIVARGNTVVVITPRDTDINIDKNSDQLKYDGHEKSIKVDSISGVQFGDTVQVELENKDANVQIKNAGSYMTKIKKVTGQGVQNYRWPENIDIKIAPRILEINFKKKRKEYVKGEKQVPQVDFSNVAEMDKRNSTQISISGWSIDGKSVNGVEEVGKYKIRAAEINNRNYKLPVDAETEFVIIPKVVKKAKEITWGQKKKQIIQFSRLVRCNSKARKNISISIPEKYKKKTKNFLRVNQKKKRVEITYTKKKIRMTKIPIKVKLTGKMKDEKLKEASIRIKLRQLDKSKLKIDRKPIGNRGYKYLFIYNFKKTLKGATGIEVRMKKGGNKDIYLVFDYYMKNRRKSNKDCYIKFKKSTIKRLGGKATFKIKACYGKNKSKAFTIVK